MAAGPPPLTVHPERLPAVVGFDAAAAAAAVRLRIQAAGSGGSDAPGGATRRTGSTARPDALRREAERAASTAGPDSADRFAELAGWIAGCTGSVPPQVLEHVVPASGAGVALPSVGHVARAVDEGRERAAAAAAAGGTVLVAVGAGAPAILGRVDAWLAGDPVDPAIRGPLGALWRLGDEQLAMLCGLLLGGGRAWPRDAVRGNGRHGGRRARRGRPARAAGPGAPGERLRVGPTGRARARRG